MSRRTWLIVAALAVLGLGLRIAAAQGALWLDEAWSAAMAHDAATPLGVLLNINHDNNHHLNTLWLLLVGPAADPVLQRAFSIFCGTATILVAALIAARHGTVAALCAALLFAVSPLMVTYGAEARGYAPMLLALLTAMLLVTRWLDDPERRVPAVGLALTVLLGMLSQLTMVFGLAAMSVWIVWMLCRERVTRASIDRAIRVLVPLLLPAAAVLGFVAWAAMRSGTGLQIGAYEPFGWWKLVEGVGVMLLVAAGGPAALVGALLLMLPADAPEGRPGPRRDLRFLLLALLVPVGVALLQIGNSGAPRYHLIAGAAVLMLIAIRSGGRLEARNWLAGPVAALLFLITVASLITDARLIANRRGDPGAALDLVQAAEPAGGQVAVDMPRSSAVLRMAAASRDYPIAIVEAACPAPRFLFADRDGKQPLPDAPERCGARYRPVAEGHPSGLSGTHWKLYERN
jgi:hypothetical protein